MLPRPPLVFLKEATWSKVITLGLTLFFILLADAILSFWVPNFLQQVLSSPLLMGLVMSFSSLVGFASDLVLPQIIKGITVKTLFIFAIASSLIFSLLLLQATFTPFVLLLLLAVGIWGIYYEFLGFGGQQFVADSTPLKLHSAVWGLLSVFKTLAYFLGPLLAGFLLARGQTAPIFVALLLTLVGLIVLILSNRKHSRPMEIDTSQVSLIKEFEHWAVLFRTIWPILILSLFLGLVDATFWTTGTVWTEELSRESWAGNLFLPLYILPSVFMGFIVVRLGIFQGKKKLAEKATLVAGIFLTALAFSPALIWQLLTVLLASLALSFAYPLLDAVYSDIIARMDRERRHLIGLSSSTISLAYIIGPTAAGAITQQVGERYTFAVMGVATVLIATLLLFVTPKKLHLHQQEIHAWE